MKVRYLTLAACLCSVLSASPSWATWTTVSSSKPAWLVAGQGGAMYGADSGSVYASSDSGKTWQAGGGTALAANTALGYFNSRIWVGSATQGVVYSGDSGTTWTSSSSGMANFFTKKIEYPVYSFTALGSNILAGSYLSGDGGATWKRTYNGLPDDPASCIFGTCSLKYPSISATSTASTFLVGTMVGVYRSSDGVNWSASGLSGNKVGALVARGSTVYAGAVAGGATGLYKSTDDGVTWSALSSFSGTPTALAVHPTQANVVFVGDGNGGVFTSSDGGATWTNLSDATISGGVAALAVPADQPDSVVAATSTGMFRYTSSVTPLPAITFREITNAPRDAMIVSETITITGLTKPEQISVSGGQYSVNGGAFTSAPGIIVNGARIQVKVQASTNFETATSATLTVGSRTAVFKVTTMKQVTLTSITQVLQTPDSHVSLVDGMLQVTGAPTTPLVLTSSAPSGALLQLPTSTPVQIQSGTQILTYSAVTGSSQLSVQPITSGLAGLQVSSGTFNVQSSGSGVVPVGSSGTGAVSTLTTSNACQTNMTLARIGAQTSAFVQNCTVRYSSGGSSGGSGFAATSGTDVYGGETAELASTGDLQKVRIGSLDGSLGLPGDPAPLTTGLVIDSGTSVPLLSGNLQRFNNTQSLIDIIQAALNAQFGSTTGKATYDATSGVLTYVVNGKTYRFIPIGSPLVQTGSGGSGFQAASAATTASGSFSLAAQGIQITLAGTFGYFNDLNKSVQAFDSAAKVRLRSSGAIQITVLGSDYICAPGSAASGGGATPTQTPGFQLNNAGLITFTDSYGALQVLYPSYADFDAAQSTVAAEATKSSLSLSLTDNGNGTANFVANGTTYKLQPDYRVTSLPSAHANENWWLDGGKIYLPYSDGTAQGMAVVQ